MALADIATGPATASAAGPAAASAAGPPAGPTADPAAADSATAVAAAACAGGLAWPRGGKDEGAWQAGILAAELAALGVREAPPVAELWGLAPDPDSDPPDDGEAGIPSDV